MKYSFADQIIDTYFDYNSGEDLEQYFEESIVKNDELRNQLISELKQALSDSEFLWMPLLKKAGIANAEEVHTEGEAKAWVKTRVVEQYLAKYM